MVRIDTPVSHCKAGGLFFWLSVRYNIGVQENAELEMQGWQ